jgi:hypothetical protein
MRKLALRRRRKSAAHDAPAGCDTPKKPGDFSPETPGYFSAKSRAIPDGVHAPHSLLCAPGDDLLSRYGHRAGTARETGTDNLVEAMMRFLTSTGARRVMTGCAMLGLAAIGVAAAPQPANAWWRGGGWCCGVGIVLPPVVVAPPIYAPAPVYAPPPAYYAPAPGYAYAPGPQRVWIPAHWEGGYWRQGHWR